MDPSSGNLKIERFDFECSKHEEFVARQSINIVSTPAKKKGKKPPPSIMPESPVSEWGVPTRILHMMLVNLFFICPFFVRMVIGDVIALFFLKI